LRGAVRDVVIVGGGPAGSTTALALAHADSRLAERVVILERARYPRDKPCAGALGGRGDALLATLGVRADVPSVPVGGISFRGLSAEARAIPGRIGRVVRRLELDHALARAAASRGIEVREGVRVVGVRPDGKGGARVETTDGELGARVVVGCDGVGSVVRRAIGGGAGGPRAQVIEVDTEPVAGDPDRTLLHFDASDPSLTGYAWDFPTLIGGRALVCRGIYRLRLDPPRQDPRAEAGPDERRWAPGRPSSGERDLGDLLDARLRAAGLDPASYPNRRYAERGYDPAARLAAGPMLLVGEAAGIDPATGEGIAQAIEYGVLAGEFLAPRLGLGSPREAQGVLLDGWSDLVTRSRLARDLRVRTHLVRLFFGPRRARFEHLLTQSPDFLFVGCQHFAAQPLGWWRLGRLAVRAAAAFVPPLPARPLPAPAPRRTRPRVPATRMDLGDRSLDAPPPSLAPRDEDDRRAGRPPDVER
jgi:flavin-dependent dehydrogenase